MRGHRMLVLELTHLFRSGFILIHFLFSFRCIAPVHSFIRVLSLYSLIVVVCSRVLSCVVVRVDHSAAGPGGCTVAPEPVMGIIRKVLKVYVNRSS